MLRWCSRQIGFIGLALLFTPLGACGVRTSLGGDPRLRADRGVQIPTDSRTDTFSRQEVGPSDSQFKGEDISRPGDSLIPWNDGWRRDIPSPIDGSRQKDGTGGTSAWVIIPKGNFLMGDPSYEPCLVGVTSRQHRVTLTHRFEISTHEVTQAEFQSLMGYNPSQFKSCGKTCPVENVTWHMAAAYCNALTNKQPGGLGLCYTCTGSSTSVRCAVAALKFIYDCKGYRLPTDAEWEYAYRAGTLEDTYAGHISSCAGPDPVTEKIGWYKSNSGNTPHPVGLKQKNSWGLYDMPGNVTEWCHDYWEPDLGSTAVTDPEGRGTLYTPRVARGGDYSSTPSNLRAAHRHSSDPLYTPGMGFRCVRSF